MSDFWIQGNNGKKEQLGDTKQGVRKEQLDKKFQKLFDFFDVNNDGTLEKKELDNIGEWLNNASGYDNILDETENTRVKDFIAEKTKNKLKDVDFMGFVKSISNASADIISSEETTASDGGKQVVTSYKDGTKETIAYYPNGDYKFKHTEKHEETTTTTYSVQKNPDKQYTEKELDAVIRKNYDNAVSAYEKAAAQAKGKETAKLLISPGSYNDYKKAFIQRNNIVSNTHTSRVDIDNVELSKLAKQDTAVRDFILSHFIETHKAAQENLDSMGILDDIGAAINAGAGELFNACKNIYNKHFGNGTEEDYKNFYELVKKFEPNYDKALVAEGDLEMMREHKDKYFSTFEKDIKNYDIQKGVKFQQKTIQYQQVQVLKQRIELLKKAKFEIEQYQNEQDALVHGGAVNDGSNPASHITNANNLLLQCFDNDQEAVNLLLSGSLSGNEGNAASAAQIQALIDETQKSNAAVLSGKTFDEIKGEYNQQYKEMYGVDFVPDELNDKINDAKATGGMVKIAAITVVSILITKSPAMANIMGAAAGSEAASGAGAAFIRTLVSKYGQTVVQQGIKFAMTTGTLATDVGLTLLNQVTDNREGVQWNEVGEAAKGSAKFIYFGAYAGSPLAQAVSQKIGSFGLAGKLMSGGAKTTQGAITTTTISGDKLVQNFMNAGKSVLAKSGAFATEVGAFSGLELATGDVDPTKVFGEQAEMLTQLKLMNHVIEYMLGGKVHTAIQKANMEAAIEKSGVKNWTIKEIKTPKGSEFKTIYEVESNGVSLGRFDNANDLASAMMGKVSMALKDVQGEASNIKAQAAEGQKQTSEIKVEPEGANKGKSPADLSKALDNAASREDFAAIRDEIKKIPASAEKTALIEQYAVKYREWQTNPDNPAKNIKNQYIPDGNSSKVENSTGQTLANVSGEKLQSVLYNLKQLGATDKQISNFQKNCSDEIIDFISKRMHAADFDPKSENYFVFLNKNNFEFIKSLKNSAKIPAQDLSLVANAAYTHNFVIQLSEAFKKGMDSNKILQACQRVIKNREAQEAREADPAVIARKQAYQNGLNRIMENTSLSKGQFQEIVQYCNIRETSIQDLIIFCEKNGIKNYLNILYRCSENNGGDSLTSEQVKAKSDFAQKALENNLDVSTINHLLWEYEKNDISTMDAKLNAEIEEKRAQIKAANEKLERITKKKQELAEKYKNPEIKEDVERIISKENLPEELLFNLDTLLGNEPNRSVCKYLEKCIDNINPEKFQLYQFKTEFDNGLNRADLTTGNINRKGQSRPNAKNVILSKEYLSSLKDEDGKEVLNEYMINKLLKLGQENPEITKEVIDIAISNKLHPMVFVPLVEAAAIDKTLAFSIIDMKKNNGEPRFGAFEQNCILASFKSKLDIIKKVFELEKTYTMDIDANNLILKARTIDDVKSSFSYKYCNEQLMKEKKEDGTCIYNSFYDIRGGIEQALIENPEVALYYLNNNALPKRTGIGRVIRTLATSPKIENFVRKELNKIKDDPNLNQTDRILSIVEAVNKENLPLAEKLFTDKDFPKDCIANILKRTNEANLSYIEQLCANKEIPREHISGIIENLKTDSKENNTILLDQALATKGLDKSKIPDLMKSSFIKDIGNDAGGNAGHVDDKKVRRFVNILQNPKTSPYVVKLLNKGVDMDTADFLTKTRQNFYAGSSKDIPTNDFSNILAKKGYNEKEIGLIIRSVSNGGEIEPKTQQLVLRLLDNGVEPAQLRSVYNSYFAPEPVKPKIVRTSEKIPQKAKVVSGFRSRESVKGLERKVIDQYQPEEQIWRSEEATKKWAEEKYQAMKNLDYISTRNTAEDPEYAQKITQQRRETLAKWYEFLETDETVKDNPFAKIVIMQGITEDLLPENSKTAVEFDKTLAKKIIAEAMDNSANVSFKKSYNKALKVRSTGNDKGEKIDFDGVKGTMYTVPQTDSSSPNFEANVAKVKAYSDGTNWCIRSWNAAPYVQQGAMHFFVDEHGLTQVCIRENAPGQVAEIQKRQQNGTRPIPYITAIKDYLDRHEIKYQNGYLDDALNAKPAFDKMKAEIQTLNESKDYKGILEKLGITVMVKPDGTWELSHYSASIDKFTLNDLGINENDLLANVSSIKGNANFANSNATSLPKLEHVEGNFSFIGSNIVDVRNLKEINGYKINWNE